ncbi:hypothetical protein [Nocardia asiatica]|uniref:hypothetical protein n=1 Tax=Nocardia asiatica TaxID=209252 RepID=UPI003EDF1A3A
MTASGDRPAWPQPRAPGGWPTADHCCAGGAAQRLYDERQHTVQQIADILGLKRSTP